MKKSIIAFFTVFYLFSAAYLHAASNYKLIDLGTMGTDWACANAINNKGIIVGDAEKAAFKWVPDIRSAFDSRLPFGRVTILPYDEEPFGTLRWISAASINDNNEIVGTAQFLFDGMLIGNNTVKWDGDVYSKVDFGVECDGVDINNSSDIVAFHLMLGQPALLNDGGRVYVPVPSPSLPRAINNLGQVVGTVDWDLAFLWEEGDVDALILNDLVMDPGVNLSDATDINDSGEIVGEYEITGAGGTISYSSFLLSGGDLSDLGFEGATAINDMGQIVGSHFLYDSDGHLYNLYKLITKAVGYSCTIPGVYHRCRQIRIKKYKDLEVKDINNSGQIVGSAIIDGAEHAVLLTPIRFGVPPLTLTPPADLRIVPE